ncbi:MAG: proteasome accessory factor PafA2 [Acidimicrobiaceae bacterium]|nr:proteasome accessory factor PafA2 [Acidimicrobiaceae bacterium]MYA75588.1 proteasome accessory factor PafA2 [Acidimicrobiaceae bacterium]MYC42606.1 proteasome accessory factor PafA2 [Acidimicrobiaceae bacterium]MYG55607.1 proteasome accessory factor PafA2 [Acidimicrobiaceae bacterium]MYJ98675.1 proteasome accessory factor PafA2 [Acidimicrobiaceae bacterium]
MSIPKTIGIETEYGIVHRGTEDPNPIAASSVLINAYLYAAGYRTEDSNDTVHWDFIDETPGIDARGYVPTAAMPPDVETHLVNAVLTNGARYYVDHAHPEISTPECADARSVVLYDRAAELIAHHSMAAASEMLPPDQELVLYKNNSDGKGNSYGCHENYLVDRATPFGRIVTHCISHFVTRQIFTGAGKVGSEIPGQSTDEVPYQITQRADFFEEEVGLETTLKRPIINTRDEPHADARKYRRLHVIVGDANPSQVSTFLKVGTTALVLALIEDDALRREFIFAAPVAAIRQVSHDLTLTQPLEMVDGTTATALEIQWELLDQSRKYVEANGVENVGGVVALEVLDRWESVLTGLEVDPMSLASELDWVAKYRLIEGYRERHGLDWRNARLRALDIQYHDMRPERSLANRAGLERIVDDADATRAMSEPPNDTRAFFRGKCLQLFSDSVVAANWDSLVFDVGTDALRRVPMMEPLRGTEAHVGNLFNECDSATELLRRLGS